MTVYYTDRSSQFPNDRLLQELDPLTREPIGQPKLYRVARDEGNVYAEGTQLNASNLNANILELGTGSSNAARGNHSHTYPVSSVNGKTGSVNVYNTDANISAKRIDVLWTGYYRLPSRASTLSTIFTFTPDSDTLSSITSYTTIRITFGAVWTAFGQKVIEVLPHYATSDTNTNGDFGCIATYNSGTNATSCDLYMCELHITKSGGYDYVKTYGGQAILFRGTGVTTQGCGDIVIYRVEGVR